METQRRRCIQDLEELRVSLHHFFFDVIPLLLTDLQSYADELDAANKDIKIAKVSGQAGCVAGGVFAIVGFGLSFVTFGASLGLCIAAICFIWWGYKFAKLVCFLLFSRFSFAGAVIGGAGGVTAGGASIADFVKAKKARTITQKQLNKCLQNFHSILGKCNEISGELEFFGPIDTAIPKWKQVWVNIVLGSGKVTANFGWKMVANTVRTAMRLGKSIDVATDVTSASVPLFRALGTAASRGFHIAGGVASVVFLPIDVFFLVSNSVELHKNEAHDDSKRIREIITEVRNKCSTEKEINEMIDSCISVVLH